VLVNNPKLSLPKEDIEELRAVIHNSVIYGPRSQMPKFNEMREHQKKCKTVKGFRDCLAGKVNYLKKINITQYNRLIKEFKRIDWD